MNPKAFSKTDDSAANYGYGPTTLHWQPSGARQPERSGNFPAYFLQKNPEQIAIGNPPGERVVVHQFGVPPEGNDDFAWMQHFIHRLAPHGMAQSGQVTDGKALT